MRFDKWTCAASAGILLLAGSATSVWADGWNPNSKATNRDSVANTRHNLTQRWADWEVWMDGYRNDYNEVCVYCHTPHSASAQMGNAPLWNRTKPSGAYTLYSANTTLGRPVTQPGTASLTCLSCHDGTVAVDSIINMPNSGGYSSAQQTSVNIAFLDSWSGAGPTGNHAVLYNSPVNDCNRCHSPAMFPNMTDSIAFNIGTDLRNDHPVGILYPTDFSGVTDFNQPNAELAGKAWYFDINGDGQMDAREVRMYDTGEGYEVECASCHDPHGVPSAGPGSTFIPSFLRVANSATWGGSPSKLCLTCHVK